MAPEYIPLAASEDQDDNVKSIAVASWYGAESVV